MCRGFGRICVDLGLGREMIIPRISDIKIERWGDSKGGRELYTIREFEYRENKK